MPGRVPSPQGLSGVGCPGAVCILMSILLPQEGLPLKRSHTQVISLNLLPILTGQIKARACDWAVEGKGVKEWRKGEEAEEEGQRKKRWKESGREPHGLEKPQVARGVIAVE